MPVSKTSFFFLTRKCNNQLMKKVVKKPNDMKQIAGHCIQPPSQRPTGDKTQKKKCFEAVSPRATPKEREETKVRTPETS